MINQHNKCEWIKIPYQKKKWKDSQIWKKNPATESLIKKVNKNKDINKKHQD